MNHPEDYYYDYCADKYCGYCEEQRQEKCDMMEFLEGLIKQLYGLERFDEMMIENCLQELGLYFNLKLPKSLLKIKSTQPYPQPLTEQILDKWKSFNNKYLKTLVQ